MLTWLCSTSQKQWFPRAPVFLNRIASHIHIIHTFNIHSSIQPDIHSTYCLHLFMYVVLPYERFDGVSSTYNIHIKCMLNSKLFSLFLQWCECECYECLGGFFMYKINSIIIRFCFWMKQIRFVFLLNVRQKNNFPYVIRHTIHHTPIHSNPIFLSSYFLKMYFMWNVQACRRPTATSK